MKRFLGVFIVLFMIFSMSFSVFASWKSDLKKAKDFVLIERYDLAEKEIQNAILENPTKAELHYQVGLIYFEMDRERQWTKAFRVAAKLDESQKSKIANFYEETGFFQAKKKKLRSSDFLRYFLPAIEFGGEEKRREICIRLDSISRGYVLEPNFRKAGESFRALCRLRPENSDFACNALMRMADLYKVKNRLQVYQVAASFSDVCNFQIGEKIALLAKLNNIEKSFSDKCKKEARKYLSKSEYEEFFPPDFVIYKPGQKKVFKLKAGERSGHYVRAHKGVSNVRLQSSHGDYKIITRNGRAYVPKKLPKHFSEDFIVFGVTDTVMRIVFE